MLPFWCSACFRFNTVACRLLIVSGPEVLFKTCVAMKFVDDDDDDDSTCKCSLNCKILSCLFPVCITGHNAILTQQQVSYYRCVLTWTFMVGSCVAEVIINHTHTHIHVSALWSAAGKLFSGHFWCKAKALLFTHLLYNTGMTLLFTHLLYNTGMTCLPDDVTSASSTHCVFQQSYLDIIYYVACSW